jgi:pyrroloquinoline quinone biosynthesis protein B
MRGSRKRALRLFTLRVVLLGTAAGGGFPQWNCWCPSCRVSRSDPRRAVPRTQSSVAVSRDGERWFLLNASPDVHRQLACLPGPLPSGIRHAPVEGVITTDAELDHTLGIVLLREARQLQVYATAAVQSILESDSRLLPVTRAFADVAVNELTLERRAPLLYRDREPSGLTVHAFAVPAGPPRFTSRTASGHTVGLILEDDETGGALGFVPGCGDLDEALLTHLRETDLLLFDGTFWRDDELISLGISQRSARQMDHLPVSGPDGSLARLSSLSRPRKVYTHINNTNPMLVEDSAECRTVTAVGMEIGSDGMSFTL